MLDLKHNCFKQIRFMKPLQQSFGNWVDGAKFWGREPEIELFSAKVRAGAHLLLTAQRRMGKTSLMREAARRIEIEGDRIPLFVDLQKAASPADAIVELSLATRHYAPLWAKTKSVFGNILTSIRENVETLQLNEVSVTLRAGLNAGNWAAKGDELFVHLASAEKPVVLLLDELPLLLLSILRGRDFATDPSAQITSEGRAAANSFMTWLRACCLHHQNRVTVVVSGSVGLEPILRQAAISASANHLQAFELKPWDQPTAQGCIQALALGYDLIIAPETAVAVARRLDYCVPHHVQMFFDHLKDRCVRERTLTVPAEWVDAVYEQEMLGVRGHVELSHYEERLGWVLTGSKKILAMELLTEAAVAGPLTEVAIAIVARGYPEEPKIWEALREIIWVLEHDGYLMPVAKDYTFVSPLLRDWWRKRHSLGYIPAAQRPAT